MPLDEAVKAKLLKQVLILALRGCLQHRSETRGRPAACFDCTLASQIEFYFSESNLPRDKFLLETVSRDPDGFVSLGLLCTFSRMRALLRLADGTKEDKVLPVEVVFCATAASCCVLLAASIDAVSVVVIICRFATFNANGTLATIVSVTPPRRRL